ncbi:MAG: sugar phosphate isomerase/epimerase [Flavobacteriaceae bacterium]|nr:sugar phosphate isomerase/epimerase [Flavobacteriaceae bacterium]
MKTPKVNTGIKITILFLLLVMVSMAFGQDRFGGLALYTVREDMKNNPKETLKAVANAGYEYVEAAGYENGKFYGMEPEEFKEYLDELDLTAVSSHHSTVTLDNADEMMQAVSEAGIEYFVVPIPPMGMFTYDMKTKSMGMKGSMEEFADILNTLGKKADEYDLKLLYHNHDFELKENQEGQIPLIYLLENTDPELVNFQMDLYWVTKAGADPVSYFNKYPERFKIWHVKDMDDEGNFAPVNKGNIDFASILKEKEKSGMEYYLVEQDNTFGTPALEAIKISHRGLEEIGFDKAD